MSTQSTPEGPRLRLWEVEGSHVIMVSEPEAVADVILTTAAAVDRAPAAVRG